MSASRLHTTPSDDSLMSDASKTGVEAAKFDFSAMKSELHQSSGVGSVPPGCVPGAAMPETSQPASELVKFTTGHGMEFLTSHSSSGSVVDVKPLLADVDAGVIGGRTNDLGVKTEDRLSKYSDKEEIMKDEAISSEAATDTKISSSQSVPEIEMKTDTDKPAGTGDAVATSNVTSSSATAATSAPASDVMSVASVSDLKKESQAINYDWVGHRSMLSTLVNTYLPISIAALTSLPSFKRQLKTFLFTKSFTSL